MTYQLYLTALGATKIATAATAGGKAIHITEFAVGQGVDVDFTQRLDKQTLVSKRYQGAVSAVSQVVNQPNQYEVACIVPQDVGGWFIREVGLIDSDGDLIWVGNLPEVQKPDGSSLAAVDYRINCMVSIDNYSGAVTLVVDGNVITATRKWVDLNFANKKEMDAWLQSINDELTAIRNRPFEGIPVHGILATTKHYQSGDEVTADLRYGKWARYAQGKILAGYSLLASDIPEYKTMGNEFGENSHTLTVAEMPKHNHGSNMRFEAGEAILVDAELATKVDSGDMLDHMNEDTTASTNTTYSGNNQPHNNLQPAVVVAFWVRMPDNYVEPTYRLYWSSDENGNNVITQIKEGATVYLWLEADNLLNDITLDPVASGVFLTNLANMPQVHKDLSITQVKNGKQKALQFDTTQIGITSDSQAIASVVFSGNHLANTLLISNDTGNDINPNTINSTIVLDLDNHTATSSDSRIVLRDFYMLDGELSQINFKTEKDFLLSPLYNYSTQSVIYNKPVSDFPKTYQAIKDSVFEITGIKPNGENMVALTRKAIEPQPTASGDTFDIYAELFWDDHVQNYPNLSISLGGYSRIPRSGKYTINVKIGRWLQLDGQSQA